MVLSRDVRRGRKVLTGVSLFVGWVKRTGDLLLSLWRLLYVTRSGTGAAGALYTLVFTLCPATGIVALGGTDPEW